MALIYFLHSGDLVPRYIGVTTNTLARRKMRHIDRAKNINKSNQRSSFWVLENCERLCIELIEEVNDEVRYDAEKFWISKYRSEGFDLLNETAGGPGMSGYSFSQDSREKMSKSHKARDVTGAKNPNFGKKISEAQKLKISLANSGENSGAAKLTAAQAKSIFEENQKGTSYRDLAEKYSMSKDAIWQICTKRSWRSIHNG